MLQSISFNADHYRSLPENAPRRELLDGEYFRSPSPSDRHQVVAGRLFRMLGEHLDRRPMGALRIAPLDVYLSGTSVVQPDILLVLEEHASRIHEDGVHGAPDLAVEVSSPGTAKNDVTVKPELYRQAGVVEYWFVDPATSTVNTYRLQETSAPRLFAVGERLESVLLPGFAPAIADVFAR
ncbi:MAG: Uma2 family endonuclease [Planctomycetia bacterium]|nr:Uma2 family endonuclease [Planctomycetia bacterium]